MRASFHRALMLYVHSIYTVLGKKKTDGRSHVEYGTCTIISTRSSGTSICWIVIVIVFLSLTAGPSYSTNHHPRVCVTSYHMQCKLCPPTCMYYVLVSLTLLATARMGGSCRENSAVGIGSAAPPPRWPSGRANARGRLTGAGSDTDGWDAR